MAVLLSPTPSLAAKPAPRQCPKDFKNRSPEQVLADHRAALAAGDIFLAVCDFDDEIVVISDGGVVVGKADNAAALTFLARLFGGSVPQVNDEVIVKILNNKDYMARVLFSLNVPIGSIADGVDTYIIRRGLIVAQTSHGNIIFNGPPPSGP